MSCKAIYLKYRSTCARCKTQLDVGTRAFHHPGARRVLCQNCFNDNGNFKVVAASTYVPLQLRRVDACNTCRTELTIGAPAVWDPAAYRIFCMSCAPQ